MRPVSETLLSLLWLLPEAMSAWALYRLWRSFLPLRPRWRWLLWGMLLVCSSVIIWVGDHNLLFALPPFFAVGLWCSRGCWSGRLALTAIFFSMMMAVNALSDTYLGMLGLYALPRLSRPVLYGGVYLLLHRRLPAAPPELPPRLWRLILGLAALPLFALVAVVLLTFRRYDSVLVEQLARNQGLVVLPFVLLTALTLLLAVVILADHERLERAGQLAQLRELYYQGVRQQEAQVHTLRHDLRNHLTVLDGLLDRGKADAARAYLAQLAGSPALGGGGRLCEHEAANAVLTAKAEAMAREGLRPDVAASLPRELPVADLDLCALLGNALDNALEGARQAADRTVTVRCRAEKGLLMLRVENGLGGPVQPDLSTTKADKAAHGLGLAGMREIAERYGGTLEAGVRDGRFRLLASIPLPGGPDRP